MSKTFTLQVNRRDPRPRSPRLRSLGAGSPSSSAVLSDQIPADIAQQISAAIAALTERIASAYLSKLHDDVAAGRITFEQGLSALQTVNIEAADLVITSGEDGGGNIEADGDITAGGDLDVSGAAVIGGNLQADGNISTDADLGVSGTAVIGGDLTARSDLRVSGAAVIGGNTTVGGFTGSPSFDPDLLGHGWRIDAPGHGELDSLSLRKFLEVPELRFNRVTVRTGVQWQTFGAGLIEEVSHPDGFAANRGIIKLKLEEGEYGAVAENDYCMGIFHNENPGETNASANSDQHNGNFTFAGFQTVYFKVAAICDETGDTASPDSRNQYFIYELRPIDTTEGKAWSHQHHPQPSMSFACYANPSNDDRQSCIYSTTDYIIMLTGMTGWTYDGSNIAYIRGRLDDFTIPAKRIENGQEVTYYKQLEGYGVAFGNAYMWGSIDQFDRPAFLVTQQLFQRALAVAPGVVMANENWLVEYAPWDSTGKVQPTADAPYLYSYWLQTMSDGTTAIIGPTLSGYDNSLFTAVLSKDIISLALSDWYVEGHDTDSLTFDVDAKLLRGGEQVAVAQATATSAIDGFRVGSVTIDQYGVAHFHIVIDGFVAQQVETVLAENNYVTFRLYADQTNYAEHTLAVVENRQGDGGEDGESALLYTVEASRQTFSHTDSATIDFRFYRSEGTDRTAYRGYPLLVQRDISGNITGGPLLPPSVHSIIEWRPASDAVVKADLYLFTERMHAIEYYGYLTGIYTSYPAEPSAFLSVVLAEPVIELKLSHDGTITYPVSADTRIPEENGYTIFARMYANGVKLTLTDIGCSLVYGSDSSGVTIAQLDGAPLENIDFETVSDAAVASSTQMFRITASAVYGGRTYTLSKDVTFCAVSAGQSVEGDQGIQGCVIRLRGVWKASEFYYNDSGSQTPTDLSGVRYIDVVQYTENGTTKWYQRKPYDTGYAPGIDPTVETYWVESNSFEFIATQLLLAENANIRFGQGNQILLMSEDKDENGNPVVVGGLSGFGTDSQSYRLWLGAAQPGNAPFSVTHDGTLVAANVNSQFQDLSYCYSGSEIDEGVGVEPVMTALNIADIRTGTSVYYQENLTEVSKAVKARVYNIVANGAKIKLPTSIAYLGQRVIICNNGGDMEQTYVIQEGRKSFLGAKVYGLVREDTNSSNRAPAVDSGSTVDPTEETGYQIQSDYFTSDLWRLVESDVWIIEFYSGLMEFVAVPDADGESVVWSLINDGTSVKYLNGYRVQPNYTKQ